MYNVYDKNGNWESSCSDEVSGEWLDESGRVAVKSGEKGPGWLLLDREEIPPENPTTQALDRVAFSVLEFRARFTQEEQLAIKTTTYTDPRVEAGIDLYIEKGLLTVERKQDLLAPESLLGV